MNILKCEKCGFECASTKIMEVHKERESLNMSNYKYKKYLQKEREEKERLLRESKNE